MEPPKTQSGTAYQARFIYIDNIHLQEDEYDCRGSATLLKCLENGINSKKNATDKQAMEFNFLIHEGIVYEVRGWHYRAEDNDIFRDAYKVSTSIAHFLDDYKRNKCDKYLCIFSLDSSGKIPAIWPL